MTTQDPRITLIGSGPEARRWAWELAGHVALASGDISRSNALIVAPGSSEPLSGALEAHSRGLPVLWAAGGPVADLVQDAFAGRSLVRIYNPPAHDRGLAMLKRFVAGKVPFWRPQHVRLAAATRSQDAVEHVLWNALEFAPDGYRSIVAFGLDNSADPVSLTLRHQTGLVVQGSFGLGEHDEVVVLTPDRRLTLSEQKLRISPVHHGGPERERVLCVPAADPVAAEAELFVKAVLAGGSSVDNRRRWDQVATLVAAARTSVNEARPVTLDVSDRSNTVTPPFEVIVGGGRSAPRSGRRLTLVS